MRSTIGFRRRSRQTTTKRAKQWGGQLPGSAQREGQGSGYELGGDAVLPKYKKGRRGARRTTEDWGEGRTSILKVRRFVCGRASISRLHCLCTYYQVCNLNKSSHSSRLKRRRGSNFNSGISLKGIWFDQDTRY